MNKEDHGELQYIRELMNPAQVIYESAATTVYGSSTTAIVKGIYPLVEKALSNTTILNKYRKNCSNFVNVRSKELYDIAPFTRIYWSDKDREDFYKVMGFSEKDVMTHIEKTYYWPIKSFNPRCAKDPFTCAQLMCIRYFLLKNMKKELDMALIYLAFSGSFYPSVHFGSFPVVQPSEYRHIMEYVVNNELSQKFDLKVQGSVIGSIKSISDTWVTSYKDRLKSSSDEDVVYVLQQLHDRIKSFMVNIATLYYKVYNDKDKYLSFDSDNYDADNFRLADNDSLKGERYVTNSMTYITTHTVSYKFCKMSADSLVRTDELKAIIDSVQSVSTNLVLIRELLSITVSEFLDGSKSKEINGIDFITFSISAKPNTKNPNIIRQKEIIEKLLGENSEAYQKRKSRLATRNAYHKCLIKYYVLVVNQANK